MNVDTGEMRALTEQVDALSRLVREDLGVLIRCFAAVIGEDGPGGLDVGHASPKAKRRLRVIDGGQS